MDKICLTYIFDYMYNYKQFHEILSIALKELIKQLRLSLKEHGLVLPAYTRFISALVLQSISDH